MEDYKFYKIDSNKLDKFMLKRALFLSGIILLIILIPFLLLILTAGASNPMRLITVSLKFIMMPVGFIFVLAFLMRSQHTSKRFGIGNNAFFQLHDEEQLSMLANFGMRRNEFRNGQKRNQAIDFKKIDEIKINKNGIKIKSYDYNFWNGNGKITVPVELESYEEFHDFVKSNFPRKINIG